jgi:hypothetical protein
MIVRALVMGGLAALVMIPVHAWLAGATGLQSQAFSRYVAPLTEETLKTLCLLYPLRRREIGFLVDAAIVGFAIGAASRSSRISTTSVGWARRACWSGSCAAWAPPCSTPRPRPSWRSRRSLSATAFPNAAG